jgi:pimeloyl-ACP methyl ester carboxylesterase
MNSVESKDGTSIAFDETGAGPPLVLVDGALCYRSLGPSRKLAAALAEHFTVFTYDRRGRGDSGDTAPYAVEREIEDLEAVVEAAGGSARVYGVSSGAALALEAAARGVSISKLALYEAPFIVDASRPPVPRQYGEQLDELLGDRRRGAATRLFLRQVGLPTVLIALMRFTPMWSKLTAIAHTLPYDNAIVRDHQAGNPLPADRWTAATMPTLAIVGGKSPAWFHNGMRALAGALPNARFCIFEGQTHMVKPKAQAPFLVAFFEEPGTM